MRWFKFLNKYRPLGLALFLVLAAAALAGGDSPAPASVASGVAPPNPRLFERIARGETRVPGLSAHQAPARARRAPARPHALTGTVRALAVLVDFADKPHTAAASNFDTLLFALPVTGRGSLRDYFAEISYGQTTIDTLNPPSGFGWLRAPSNYAYYVNASNCAGAYPQNCQRLAEDIVDLLLTKGVDFRNYDNDQDGYAEPVILIHAGNGGEVSGSLNDIWSHTSGLRTPRKQGSVTIDSYIVVPEYWQETPSSPLVDMTIGVIAHEMGHGFWGLPDLYDTTLTSGGTPVSGGIGDWSLMSYGAWNGPADWGDSPAWPDAWTRSRMGMVTPADVCNSLAKTIPQPYDNPSAQTVLRLRSPVLGSREYFLLENRQQVVGSYDEYLPGNGLLIWHVDEAMTSNDNVCLLEPHSSCPSKHYLVALEQADGLRDLEKNVNLGDTGDPFPGAKNNRNWTKDTHPESSSWYSTANSRIGVTTIGNSSANMTVDLEGVCAIYLPTILKSP
jgi:immune inhibitor A